MRSHHTPAPYSVFRGDGIDRVELLERKDHLKVNATIRGLESTAPASTAEEPPNRVRLAKQGRADSPDPRPEIHIIEEIPGVDAEREVEAPIAVCSPAEETAQPAATSAQPTRPETAAHATAAATTATPAASTAPSAKATPRLMTAL